MAAIRTATELSEVAAAQAGVTVRELTEVDEMIGAERLFTQIWGGQARDAMPSNLMRALAHSGNYVAGAFRAGRLVGASVAFAWGGRPALHSHITGCAPDAQGTGAGFALKLHQRAWAADHGFADITWTYDPLVRRNGWFNLMKLGARVESYHADFYGPMDDGINAGDPTDRCLAVWPVAGGGRVEPALPTSAVPLLEEDGDGRPRILAGADAAAVLCQVPADAVELRRRDPGLAQDWRVALRQTMGRAMESGYAAGSMTRDGKYVLRRGR